MALILLVMPAASAQPRVEKNVVFGMYSGAALLMDVYRPVQSNGLGLIVIQGSGWYMPQRYDKRALKTTRLSWSTAVGLLRLATRRS